MPSKAESSTFLGSMRMVRTCSGVARSRIEVSSALMQALLPEPVAPATSRWTIFCRSASTALPVMSLPSQNASGEAVEVNGPYTSPRATNDGRMLGTSTPTAVLPGMGASTRTSVAASA